MYLHLHVRKRILTTMEGFVDKGPLLVHINYDIMNYTFYITGSNRPLLCKIQCVTI